jgi:Ca-activated chloride channel family protein
LLIGKESLRWQTHCRERGVMRWLVGVLARVVAVGVLATTPVSGQVPTAPPAGQPQITFKSGVEVVTVTVTVRDARGRLVRDLERSDFEVIDSGRPRQVRDFFAGDAPVSLAVLLDLSGSMAVGGNIDRAREAVAMTMRALRQGADEAALLTFDSDLQEVVGFTSDLDRVRRVSLEGRPWGQTSLYDAVAQTTRIVAQRTNRHRAVLVVSDGVDTASRVTPADVSRVASEIEVPIYLLTVVTPVDHPGGELGLLKADDRSTPIATLADLARWTGGDLHIASNSAHMLKVVAALVAELRHHYVITFEPSASPGWHPLEIRTKRRNLVVRARSGYVSGTPHGEE